MTAAYLDACRFRMQSSYVRVKQTFGDYAADCVVPGRPLLSCAESLMRKIHREFSYAPGATNISTSAIEAFEARRGVCQDFAHIMLACLRSRGLAARYVSGYLRTTPPPGSDVTSAMFHHCAASSSAADGTVYRFAFRYRQSKIEITKSFSGDLSGQAELSSREEAKRDGQKGSTGCEAATSVERAGRARGARARQTRRMT